MIIAPSLLAANFLCLEKQCEELLKHDLNWLHYDVMDGYFVPNHSFGADILRQLKQKYPFFYDVHLMVSQPKIFIEFYRSLADVITIHIEACSHPQEAIELLKKIRSYGIKAGLSIKPNTSVEVIETCLPFCDLVLVMSVEPGFGGQPFMIDSLEKVKYLQELKLRNQYSFMIQIDGGINLETAKLAQEAGVENCVVGSALFKDFPNQLKAYQ
jgi:ribulose-phosphate 3-epimerase